MDGELNKTFCIETNVILDNYIKPVLLKEEENHKLIEYITQKYNVRMFKLAYRSYKMNKL